MRCVITNAFGPQNRGDHELLQKLMGIVEDNVDLRDKISIHTTYPSESTKAFDGRHRFVKSPFYKPRSVSELIALFWDGFIWVISSYLPFLSWALTAARKERFREIISADMVLMCPGGYLYSNGLSFYVNLINVLPVRLSRGKRIISPMSVGPFLTRFDWFVAKYILSQFDAVHVRESYSFGLVSGMGLAATFTPDLAWYEEDSSVSEDLAWAGHFVGTVIDWTYPFSSNPEEMRERYQNELLDAARVLSDAAGGRPLILYNQVGAGDGSSDDERLIERLVDMADGRIVFDNTAVNPEILRARLNSCEGVLASRFHSALFAMQAGCPFVSIAYQPKAEYILKDLGLSEYFRSIDLFDGREVAHLLIEVSGKRKEFASKIAAKRRGAAAMIDESFVSKHFRLIE